MIKIQGLPVRHLLFFLELTQDTSLIPLLMTSAMPQPPPLRWSP